MYKLEPIKLKDLKAGDFIKVLMEGRELYAILTSLSPFELLGRLVFKDGRLAEPTNYKRKSVFLGRAIFKITKVEEIKANDNVVNVPNVAEWLDHI